jgi:hypothetical protein
MLVMDQKVTSQAVLGELDTRAVKFLTLRMRSPALLAHINALRSGDYKTITLDRHGPHNKPRVHEDTAATLSGYPATVRQLVVTGLGLDIMLAVLAQALLASLRARLPGYHNATPDVVQRRLLETPGQITPTTDTITVRLERRATHPSYAKPPSPTTPAYPGSATASSATNSPEPCAEPPAWKSAQMSTARATGRAPGARLTATPYDVR